MGPIHGFKVLHRLFRAKPLRALSSAGPLVVLLCFSLSPIALPADVNKAPKSYLLGPETWISNPNGIAVDSQGNRYVANGISSGITIYQAGASGNTAPVRTIRGSNTMLVGPRSVAVDADGRIYVGDLLGAGTNKVAVFAPGADGNVAPERVLIGDNTLINWPQGLAVDSTGRIYVANKGSNSITVYAPGSDGNTSPIRIIQGAATGLDVPWGLALTSGNVLHVVNSGSATITSYASGATGNVSPIRTIGGAATLLTDPKGLAADSLGNLYVTNTAGIYSVSVFGPSASGDVAPAKRLTGSETDLNVCYGIAIANNHDVLVPVNFGDRVLTYSPLVSPPGPPTVVRSLTVSGMADSAKRTVKWRKPKLDGGAPITEYVVSVTAKGKKVLTKKLSADKLQLVLKKSDLRVGKNVIRVEARNKYGLSPKASTVARVAAE